MRKKINGYPNGENKVIWERVTTNPDECKGVSSSELKCKTIQMIKNNE